MPKISKKIILVGSFGVGKTSLMGRFVHHKFSEQYLSTLGVKIDKKVINIDDTELTMLLWDIAGEITQSKVPQSYFLGAAGIIFVFDLTRSSTYLNLASELEYLHKILPGVPYCIAGNKKDLLEDGALEKIKNELPIPCDFFTSARTGEHVEEIFTALGKKMI